MTMTETETATASLSAVTAATVGRCLIHVGTVASKDLARGVLAGILIGTAVDPDTDATMLTFTATDSYRLIHVTVPLTADDTVAAFDPFVIDAKQAAKVGKLITRKNVDRGAGFTVTGPVFTLSTADGSGNVDRLTGSFPEFDKLMNIDSTGELPQVNADLLSGLLDAMAGVITVSKDLLPKVRLSAVSGTKPMRWEARVDQAAVIGIIMPIR